MRVALGTKDPVNFLDWDRNIDPRLDNRTVKKNVCVSERLVDVCKKLFFRFPAVLARKLFHGQLGKIASKLLVEEVDLGSALAHDADPEFWIRFEVRC